MGELHGLDGIVGEIAVELLLDPAQFLRRLFGKGFGEVARHEPAAVADNVIGQGKQNVGHAV